MPRQWDDCSSASDFGSIESARTSDGTDVAPTPAPDLELITELTEMIDRNPRGKEIRVLLMQHYALCGWHAAAKEEAYRVLNIDPTSQEAQIYLVKHSEVESQGGVRAANGKKKVKSSKDTNKSEGKHGAALSSQRQGAQAPPWQPSLHPITSIAASQRELEEGYVALIESAKLCLRQTKLVKDLKDSECENQISDLEALANGQVSSVVRFKPLEGVKVVAEAIIADSKDGDRNGLNTAVKDLEDLTRWCRKSGNPAESSGKGKSRSTVCEDQDKIREALVKRVKVLKALLPKSLQPLADLALMHAEHEILHRKYTNDETMTLDPIADIPRAKFWTSEDGYAWDMEELARAITSGKGVMRNPLSKQMFTRADIRAIVQHPLGKGLQALQVEQGKLKRGIRPQTIDELDKLAKVLQDDNSEDGKESHLAVEIFVSYTETLPDGEQKAIDNLNVPAKDSHTGIAFDATIGEALRDVEGNRICSHKAGDLLSQAVKFLR